MTTTTPVRSPMNDSAHEDHSMVPTIKGEDGATVLGPDNVAIGIGLQNPGARMGDLDEVLRSGPLKPPYLPGMEAAGVVDQIGKDAQTDLRVGDRVMAIVMPIDATGGAYAEYLAVDADQAARAPAGTTHAGAATLPMNGLTARLALDVLDIAPE